MRIANVLAKVLTLVNTKTPTVRADVGVWHGECCGQTQTQACSRRSVAFSSGKVLTKVLYVLYF